MKRPLQTVFISASTSISASTVVLISGSTLAPTAWAGDSACPLHKRLATQAAQQSPGVLNTSTDIAPQELTPDVTLLPVSPMLEGTSAAMSPSIVPQIETSERIGDSVIVKETQNNYGSATPDANIKASLNPSPHAGFTAILRKYVSAPDNQGLTHFNYGGLKANTADKAALDSYINELEAINPDDLSANAAIAYYANLYNAVTVQVVTDNYPLKSIRKLGSFSSGPWKKDLFTVNGMPTSLDTVEHKILRKKLPSPYIHYMVNCASVGCPNLPQAAWEADSLERLRVQAARDYINSPRGAVITAKGLKLSSIFKWFKEDFGGNEQGVLEHIRAHAGPDLVQAIDNGAKITGYHYDWSLND